MKFEVSMAGIKITQTQQNFKTYLKSIIELTWEREGTPFLKVAVYISVHIYFFIHAYHTCIVSDNLNKKICSVLAPIY